MRDALGPGTMLGYCTNVHPCRTLEQLKSNLDLHAVAVKQRITPNEPMGVGLWFPASVAAELASDEDQMKALGDWLGERGLVPFTANAFPFGDFHQDVIKHAVYQPDWSTRERAEYTLDVARILDAILPEGEEGSISTLPIGWGDSVDPGWADMLGGVFDALAALYEQTGRIIHLDLEPEPGCELSTTEEVLMLMTTLGMIEPDPEVVRRHLRICLDVCHQAVMFEKPGRMLQWARESGFSIGKVQLSSALRAPFKGLARDAKSAMRAELQRFVEPRYLHQTTIGTKEGHQLKAFHDDLPDALQAHPRSGDEWRVHFHVPLYLREIGSLATTQDHVTRFLHELKPEDGIRHFEVETYAWDVLPEPWRVDELAEGIAREMQWVRAAYQASREPTAAQTNEQALAGQ